MSTKFFGNTCFALSLIWIFTIAFHEIARLFTLPTDTFLGAIAALPLPRVTIGTSVRSLWPLALGLTGALVGAFLRTCKENEKEGDV